MLLVKSWQSGAYVEPVSRFKKLFWSLVMRIGAGARITVATGALEIYDHTQR